jgi:RHS repeat-associated protein
MTGADNRYSRIARSYYRNGQVATDTQRIRGYDAPSNGPGGETYDTADFTSHQYGLSYTYDIAGRRASLALPGVSGLGTRYYYSRETGMADSLRDASGNGFQFTHNDRFQLTGMTGPGGVTESRGYDSDGQLTTRTVSAAHGTVMNESLVYDGRGKVVQATSIQDGDVAYSGLGHVVGAEWNRRSGISVRLEELRVDALGNRYRERQSVDGGPYNITDYQYSGGTHELISTEGRPENPQCSSPYHPSSTSERSYDVSGNVVQVLSLSFSNHACSLVQTGRTRSLSYYGAEGRLRFFQRFGNDSSASTRAVYEEYRYDALGRRVMLRSRPDSNCATTGGGNRCVGALERYVWDGAQLVREERTSSGMHQGPSAQYGTVVYTHGGGIDHPLALGSIIPHADWRGVYQSGTSTSGTNLRDSVDWPGRNTLISLDVPNFEPSRWHGSLVRSSLDNSGLLYRRNRYYDPASGQFTQTDPIGLAGGLNLYGFAGGDPVNFSDPFGLCPEYAGGDGKGTVADCPREILEAWAAAKISLAPKATWKGVDPTLRDAVIMASIELNTPFFITATTNGSHATNSHHFAGRAVDIGLVNGVSPRSLSADDPLARQVAESVRTFIPPNRQGEFIGPNFAYRMHRDNWTPQTQQVLIRAHRGHIHVSTSPPRGAQP